MKTWNWRKRQGLFTLRLAALCVLRSSTRYHYLPGVCIGHVLFSAVSLLWLEIFAQKLFWHSWLGFFQVFCAIKISGKTTKHFWAKKLQRSLGMVPESARRQPSTGIHTLVWIPLFFYASKCWKGKGKEGDIVMHLFGTERPRTENAKTILMGNVPSAGSLLGPGSTVRFTQNQSKQIGCRRNSSPGTKHAQVPSA